METKEALTRFLLKCEERGLALETRRKYHGYLRHFADEHPIIPETPWTIEQFLKKRGETPSKRGNWFSVLQAFYSYLEEFEGLKSPVPPKGKVGRPPKRKLLPTPDTEQIGEGSTMLTDKISSGGPSVSTSTSISTMEAVKMFLTSRKVKGCSERTLQEYGYHFKPFIMRYPMLPLTVEPIEEFLGSVKGVPETRWTVRRVLKALYHFLERRRKIPKDLFDWPDVKVPRKVRRVLDIEELRRLFDFAEDFQQKVILTLLIDSKIRAEELCYLTREHVHPDYITVTGKTGERNVPINPGTYELLVQLAAEGPLFRVNSRPMRREYLRVMLRRLMERSGLEGKKLGPHILRHSASVQHMMFGGDLLSLKEELGHATTRMTEKYGQLAFPQVRQKHEEVDVLGKIAPRSPLERAICHSCRHQLTIEVARVKETECPECHQVGSWYLPDYRTEGVSQ